MTKKLVIAVLLSLGAPTFAHRLDEYLQAAIISLEKDRVDVFLRLIPGVAVASTVLASIDADKDGVLSESERQAYAAKVLNDLSLRLDGKRLEAHLRSIDFPPVAEMKAGIGEIQMEFSALLPKDRADRGADRQLIFENRHQVGISVYMVNCLAPRDRNTEVIAQNRNENQSFYQLNYKQKTIGLMSLPLPWLWGFGAGLSVLVLLLAKNRAKRARS